MFVLNLPLHSVTYFAPHYFNSLLSHSSSHHFGSFEANFDSAPATTTSTSGGFATFDTPATTAANTTNTNNSSAFAAFDTTTTPTTGATTSTNSDDFYSPATLQALSIVGSTSATVSDVLFMEKLPGVQLNEVRVY